MKVLSLFDGISCLRVALGNRSVEYLASEIEPNAIKISKKNYPDIKHLGDVKDISGITGVDLLCGGSPCTDLSIAKKDRQGLEGTRSKLFWEYVRIWKECKPKWFILENVASMPKKDRDIITATLGVEPIMIDASLVSAQSRKRLFWTNIPVRGLPTDRGIVLKDILQPDAEVDERMVMKGKAFCLTSNYYKAIESNSVEKKQRTMVVAQTPAETDKPIFAGYIEGTKRYENQEELSRAHHQQNRIYDPAGKAPPLQASETSGRNHILQVGHVGKTNGQANRVYDPAGKSTTLTALAGGSGGKTGLYVMGRIIGRKLNEDGKRDDKDDSLEYKRTLEVRSDEKSNTITQVQKDNIVVAEKHIRKLTPIECERLQSLPDNYTAGVSNTARYKALGNGFNVEVIKFILSFLPPP